MQKSILFLTLSLTHNPILPGLRSADPQICSPHFTRGLRFRCLTLRECALCEVYCFVCTCDLIGFVTETLLTLISHFVISQYFACVLRVIHCWMYFSSSRSLHAVFHRMAWKHETKVSRSLYSFTVYIRREVWKYATVRYFGYIMPTQLCSFNKWNSEGCFGSKNLAHGEMHSQTDKKYVNLLYVFILILM